MAEKIRASYQRMRPQDIYDLYLFAGEPYERGLVKTLTIIKFWNTREPFNPYELFTKIQQEEFNFSELRSLVREGILPSREEMISTVLEGYSYLTELDRELRKIIADSRGHREETLVNEIKGRLSRGILDRTKLESES